MSARKIVLAATACTLFSAAGVAAGSADAEVRPASGFPAAHGFSGAAGPPTSAECLKALGIARCRCEAGAQGGAFAAIFFVEQYFEVGLFSPAR